MTINEIWAYAQPFVTSALGTGIGGLIIWFISRLIMNKLIGKININKTAESIANQLVGSEIKIDLQTYAQKQLAEIDNKLHNQVNELRNTITAQTTLLIDLCRAWSNSKTLTQDMKDKMLADVGALEGATTVCEQKTSIVLSLDKKEQEQAETALQKGTAGVRMG